MSKWVNIRENSGLHSSWGRVLIGLADIWGILPLLTCYTKGFPGIMLIHMSKCVGYSMSVCVCRTYMCLAPAQKYPRSKELIQQAVLKKHLLFSPLRLKLTFNKGVLHTWETIFIHIQTYSDTILSMSLWDAIGSGYYPQLLTLYTHHSDNTIRTPNIRPTKVYTHHSDKSGYWIDWIHEVIVGRITLLEWHTYE